MTDPARLAAELSRALDQLQLAADEPDELRRQLMLSAASATLMNVRAHLWSEQAQEMRPLRKLALVGRYEASPALRTTADEYRDATDVPIPDWGEGKR